MEFISDKPTLNLALNGAVQVTVTAPKSKLKSLTELKDKKYDVIIKEHREKRSANANAYFHVLADKIAESLNANNYDIKRLLVLAYGVPDKVDNENFTVDVPEGADISKIYPYPKWIGKIIVNNIEKDQYVFYKHTHLLNTAEMAKLIDGTVSEAKKQGIDTRTPGELAKMKSLWGQE